MSFGQDGGVKPKQEREKLKAAADRQFAEDFPSGVRLQWLGAPIVRLGSYGHEPAPSARGTITMIISGARFVRFELPDGSRSEPREVVHGQKCEALE